ncbi:unnamed protein product [Vicia faba]|uniref:IBH1-like N-terminal domain-containing protein n=1 Tax=Vicia faba TaxID=3906 RepID=A0AAV1ALZ9_VICFA|nr:unnamed protein product [Vicia faba]
MEAQEQNKRRRDYCMEPNKIAQSIFARKYLSYLVPALMKIKENPSFAKENNSGYVKYEVDMAMVLSAQGCAWSNGLKLKLQKDHVKGNEGNESNEDNEEEEKMKNLIKLIPGGEEICDEQVVCEVESYIRCLEMQVNVLQCLLEEMC